MSLQTPDTLIYEKGLLNSTLLTQSSFLISESDTYAHLLSHVACLFTSSNGPFQGCQMCFLFQKQTADILDWCEQQIACENNLCWYRWEFTSIRRCQICSLRGLNVPVNYHWPSLHQHSVIRTVFTCWYKCWNCLQQTCCAFKYPQKQSDILSRFCNWTVWGTPPTDICTA